MYKLDQRAEFCLPKHFKKTKAVVCWSTAMSHSCFYRSVVFERNLDLTDIFMNLVMRSSNQLWKNIANEGNAFEHNCKNDLIFLISFIKTNSIGLNIPCRSHI